MVLFDATGRAVVMSPLENFFVRFSKFKIMMTRMLLFWIMLTPPGLGFAGWDPLDGRSKSPAAAAGWNQGVCQAHPGKFRETLSQSGLHFFCFVQAPIASA